METKRDGDVLTVALIARPETRCILEPAPQ